MSGPIRVNPAEGCAAPLMITIHRRPSGKVSQNSCHDLIVCRKGPSLYSRSMGSVMPEASHTSASNCEKFAAYDPICCNEGATTAGGGGVGVGGETPLELALDVEVTGKAQVPEDTTEDAAAVAIEARAETGSVIS